jgi:hypothetical protein
VQIYIGYKYRYLSDKEALKSELQQLSDSFESIGHKVFILGRDVQKWESHRYSKISTTLQIIKNLKGKDMLFVYLNSKVHSNGLPVEILLAKLYGLQIVIAKHSSITGGLFAKFANKVIDYTDINDLKEKWHAKITML